MEEIWKDIPDFNGAYQASTLGRIRSVDRVDCAGRRLKGQILTGRPSKSGHLYINPSIGGTSKNYTVHRLVARTFFGEIDPKLDVCHNDGNPQNNVLSNLRVDTRAGNASDRLKHGTHARGDRCATSRLTADQVYEIRVRYKNGESAKCLAEKFGITIRPLFRIVKGDQWKGFPGPISAKHSRAGDGHISAKLTSKKVSDMRQQYCSGAVSASELQSLHGISRSSLQKALRGKTWREAGGPIAQSVRF